MKRTKPIKIKRRGRPRHSGWAIVKSKHEQKKPRPCACGCGAVTKTGFFIQGHMVKLRRLWERHIQKGMPLNALASAMLEEFRLNPYRRILQVAADYWRKQSDKA